MNKLAKQTFLYPVELHHYFLFSFSYVSFHILMCQLFMNVSGSPAVYVQIFQKTKLSFV